MAESYDRDAGLPMFSSIGWVQIVSTFLWRHVQLPPRAGRRVRGREAASVVDAQVERVRLAREAKVLGRRLLAVGETGTELLEVVLAVRALGVLVARAEAPDRLARRVRQRGQADLAHLRLLHKPDEVNEPRPARDVAVGEEQAVGVDGFVRVVVGEDREAAPVSVGQRDVAQDVGVAATRLIDVRVDGALPAWN